MARSFGIAPRYTRPRSRPSPSPRTSTPDLPASAYAADPRAQAIAAAAAELNARREAWLNPPDLVTRVPEVVPGYPDRLLPVDDAAAEVLKKRTLTNLYNQRPAWLDHAHARLDEAVAEAYGWGDDWRAGRSTTTPSSPASSPSTRPGRAIRRPLLRSAIPCYDPYACPEFTRVPHPRLRPATRPCLGSRVRAP